MRSVERWIARSTARLPSTSAVLAPQLLLEVVVEVFVGIVLRCVGREEEEFPAPYKFSETSPCVGALARRSAPIIGLVLCQATIRASSSATRLPTSSS
jgi:hypothetical protein